MPIRKSQYEHLQRQHQKALERIKELEAGLRWYARRDYWTDDEPFALVVATRHEETDGGYVARVALDPDEYAGGRELLKQLATFGECVPRRAEGRR